MPAMDDKRRKSGLEATSSQRISLRNGTDEWRIAATRRYKPGSIARDLVRRVGEGSPSGVPPRWSFVMNYVDGFVVAVPTAAREQYLRIAQMGSVVFKEHGALGVVECWGDDVPEGKLTSFPMAVQRKADETVVFSWITWPSKAARNEGMRKFMEDPRTKDMQMPFDGKRMIYGGFDVILDTAAK